MTWSADEQYLDAQSFVLHSLHKTPYNRQGYISFQQGSANLTHRCLHIVLVELTVDLDDIPSLANARADTIKQSSACHP